MIVKRVLRNKANGALLVIIDKKSGIEEGQYVKVEVVD